MRTLLLILITITAQAQTMDIFNAIQEVQPGAQLDSTFEYRVKAKVNSGMFLNSDGR